MTPEQESAIRKHGQNLQAIFPATARKDPVKLCKKLRRVEHAAGRLALALCNGDIDQDEYDRESQNVLDILDGVVDFTAAGVPVFINGDPRGYALKIDSDWLKASGHRLHTDWGGYGIIAPEIGPNGDN